MVLYGDAAFFRCAALAPWRYGHGLHFPLILDGATGTELQRRGYTGDISMEQWTLAHPDCIRELQRGYVDAGSRVLYTPTWRQRRQAGSPRRDGRCGGVQPPSGGPKPGGCRRQSAGGRRHGPHGLFLPPLGDASFQQLVDAYAQQVAGLEEAEVDLYVIETMISCPTPGPRCWPSAPSPTSRSLSPSPATERPQHLWH